MVFWLAIQVESVQNKLVDVVTKRLSKEWNTTVDVKHVSFSLFSSVVLDSVLIEDTRGDTLLFSQRLDAKFRSGFMGIIRQDLDIESIDLYDTRFHHYKDTSLMETNMGFILDYFSKEPSPNDTLPKEKAPFLMNVDRFSFHKLLVEKIDKTKGEFIEVFVTDGKIEGLDFDSDNNQLKTKGIFLEDFHFHFDKKEKIRKDDITDSTSTDDNNNIEKDTSYIPFTALADKILASKGHFHFVDHTREFQRTKYENTMDFTDLDVQSINAEIDSFWFREDLWFKGELKHISAKEKNCGFVLKKSSAKEVEVSRKGLHLYGMELNTPYSQIGDTLEMKYRKKGYYAFEDDFVNEVYLTGKFNKGSRIALRDIFTFAPELQSNKFFNKNKDEVIEAEGVVKGKINSLKTKGFTLKVGRDLIIRGDFNSRNIAVRGEEFMNLELTELKTSIPTLRALIPGFNPPSQFDKLGVLDFQGKYYGFFTDFTAIGSLNTALGKVESDINLKGDKNNANYSGSLSLIDFDLSGWSGNTDLGLVNFSAKVNNASGLTLDEINADLDAEIRSLTFKNYKYQFLNIGGKFDKKRFEGNLDIKDNNIDLEFSGLVDFNEKIPTFNFEADVHKLLFHPLNLSKKQMELKGKLDFDFKGLNADELDGTASAKNVEFTIDSILLELDSIYAYSFLENETTKKVGVESDVLKGELLGTFQITELGDAILGYFNRNFPGFANRLKVPKPKKEFTSDKYFTFDFTIPNSKNFTQLISPKLDTIFNASIEGYFNNVIDTLFLDFAFEKGTFNDIEFKDGITTAVFKKDEGTFDVGAYHTIVRDSLHLPPLALYNDFYRDTFDFEFNANDFTNFLDDINLVGSLTLEEPDIYKVAFETSDLVLMNQKWEILDNNYIKFGKDFLETENFILNNQDFLRQSVELNSKGKKGLSLSLSDFDLDYLNDYINYDKLNIRGEVDFLVEIEDVFKLQGIEALATMDSVIINDDFYGNLNLNARAKDISSEVKTKLFIDNGAQSFSSQGFYRPPYLKINKNSFGQEIKIKKYPLAIANYFIGEEISNTTGFINADLKLVGNPENPRLSGLTEVKDAATTINYLQTRIFVPEDTILVAPDEFNLTGLKIYDKEGNQGMAFGGIKNNKFRKFELDLILQSPKFIALDTKEEDNEVFYGKGVGDLRAEFTGDFKNTNIDIIATTGPETKIILPLSTSGTQSELSFITFNSDKEENENEEIIKQFVPEELRGVELTMALNLTPDAEIQMIFDEKTGDILKGRGHGNLKIDVTRDGEFNMYGDYIVEEGSYLFTLLNVVNKPFLIKKGGVVSFSGDPLEAVIDLEASYAKLSTTPYNFILEYLTNDGDKAQAQQTTPVDLTMKLKGILSQPDIDFDIIFPNLHGRLKNFTDNKLRIVREDENELNRQVLGLIAFGSFFPSDMAYSNTGLIDGGINTLSEMLSNQLSIYLSELLSEVITDVDFDINYRYYELSDLNELDPDAFKSGSELEIRFKKRLFNNRLTINAGSNFDIDGGENGAFLAGDLLIEYLLTPDGRFKLRFYQQSDQTISGERRNETGVGLTYQREFDTWKELFRKKYKGKKIYDSTEGKSKAQEAFQKSKGETPSGLIDEEIQ